MSRFRSAPMLLLLLLLGVILVTAWVVATQTSFFRFDQFPSAKQQKPMIKSSSSSSSSSVLTFPEKEIELIWLLSFPNSGTTYTLENVKYISHATMGTNYAKEVYTDRVVKEETTATLLSAAAGSSSLSSSSSLTWQQNNSNDDKNVSGPWILDASAPIIPHRMLIKTHCAGYDDQANYRNSEKSYERFLEGCTSFTAPKININNNNNNNNTAITVNNNINNNNINNINTHLQMFLLLTEETEYIRKECHYNASQIHGVVHLIRNPIHNLISRMHLGVRNRWKRWNETERMNHSNLLEDTREAVLEWCQLTDTSFWQDTAKQLLNSSLYQEMAWIRDTTPCHAELFRYAQWHNRAVELIRRQNMSSSSSSSSSTPSFLRLYYEDYSHHGADNNNSGNDDIDQNTKRLLEYLQLEALESSPLPFHDSSSSSLQQQQQPGKTNTTYQDLFTREHRTRLKRLLQKLATKETWDVLKRYF